MQGRRITLEIGARYGRLVTVAHLSVDSAGRSQSRFACDCGREVTIANTYVVRGQKSCGCWRRERTGRLNIKSGDPRIDGAAGTPTYVSWKSMLNRCTNPAAPDYDRYGGRGITVCDRWMSFDLFVADMGERPSGTSIDRIDNARGYEPGNCRWATRKQQARNTRTSARISALGESKTIAEWSECTGLSARAISSRRDAGWSPDDIVTKPLRITSLSKEQP